MIRGTSLLVALACAGLHPAAPLPARQESSPRRVPVLVLLLGPQPRTGEPFMIHRRPDEGDVIALRPDATATDLADAVRALLTARQVEGDTATERRTIRVRPRPSASLHAG